MLCKTHCYMLMDPSMQLEHAVMHPVRHRFQLEELMEGPDRA